VKEDNVINIFIATKSLLDPRVYFFEESKGILPMRAFHHSILFHDLPNQLPYNAIVIGSEKTEKKIKKLLEEGNIFPNSSPHGSPVFIIPENK